MKTVLHFLIVTAILAVGASPAAAAPLSLTERAALIQEVQRLTAQVIALQSQLRNLQTAPLSAAARASHEELYQSRFYDGSYEAIYKVVGSTLVPRRGIVRSGDQAVFSNYLTLMGDEFVKSHISEFRVFNDRDNLMSGFVEQKDDASWLLVINRFDNDLVAESADDFMIELLLHESAHIIFFLDDRYQIAFTKQFWTNRSMQSHSSRLERRSALESKASIGATFYDQHPTWFVSDYAPTSPNEDLVETFVAFVTKSKANGDTVAQQKINFFYKYPELVDWRSELRSKALTQSLLK